MYERDNIERGEVYNDAAFNQKMLFSGMKYERNITPTDWDLFIDFNGNLFIYGEGKKVPADLTIGQKKSIEHVCNSHSAAGNIAVGFMFEHNVDSSLPVFVKDQLVVKYYWKGKWINYLDKPSVSNFIDKVLNWCKNKKILI